MSTQTPLGFQATDLPDAQTDTKPVLATLVTKSLPHRELPDWECYRGAAWAIQDTIERVSPEAQA